MEEELDRGDRDGLGGPTIDPGRLSPRIALEELEELELEELELEELEEEELEEELEELEEELEELEEDSDTGVVSKCLRSTDGTPVVNFSTSVSKLSVSLSSSSSSSTEIHESSLRSSLFSSS